MKYIKSYTESLRDLIDYKDDLYKKESDFIEEVEDIILPIKDEGFDIDVNKNERSSDEFMESEGEIIRFYIEKAVDDIETKSYHPTEEFIDTLSHLVSFIEENEYTCSMELVGENGGTISENECIAYSEFSEDDMTVEELLDIKSPINYIRFIIYKPE